jgi:hypothetical protein
MLIGTLIQVYLHAFNSARLLMILLQVETCSCLKYSNLLLFYTQWDEQIGVFFCRK